MKSSLSRGEARSPTTINAISRMLPAKVSTIDPRRRTAAATNWRGGFSAKAPKRGHAADSVSFQPITAARLPGVFSKPRSAIAAFISPTVILTRTTSFPLRSRSAWTAASSVRCSLCDRHSADRCSDSPTSASQSSKSQAGNSHNANRMVPILHRRPGYASDPTRQRANGEADFQPLGYGSLSISAWSKARVSILPSAINARQAAQPSVSPSNFWARASS